MSNVDIKSENQNMKFEADKKVQFCQLKLLNLV